IALLFAAMPAFAQSVIATAAGVVVAGEGTAELFRGGRSVWRSEGVIAPAKIVADDDRLALLDPLHDELRLIDLRSGKGRSFRTGATPIDGVFAEGDFYVMARDARTLERFGRDGARASLRLDADPAFLRVANGRIYLYSRLAGTLSEITPQTLAVRRTTPVAPFASAMESDSRSAYLVYPRRSRVAIVSLSGMSPTGEMEVGAVPVSLAFASGSSALSARTLAVADPASKKVWLVEGAQSTTEAFTRGLLRGLIGLGLYANRTSQFPTGVDRVWTRGSRWIAYDSASRTLYRFTKGGSSILASGVGPSAFAITGDGVVVWTGRRLRIF
ncbi:MAG: hypothetical protein ABI837_18565, partial [Acidobacteriota bacterium]